LAQDRYDPGVAQPNPELVVLACMDPRIDLPAILGARFHGSRVIRNAGGLPTADVVRSLVLCRFVFGTREVTVIQHTRCGLQGLDEGRLKSRITRATGADFSGSFGSFGDVEATMRETVAALAANPLLVDVSVRGLVYDVDRRGVIASAG
jgi:carbonic anhydrase